MGRVRVVLSVVLGQMEQLLLFLATTPRLVGSSCTNSKVGNKVSDVSGQALAAVGFLVPRGVGRLVRVAGCLGKELGLVRCSRW